MKLEKVLNNLGALEKNAFIKIIDTIILNKPSRINEIEKVLSSPERGLKNVDNSNIASIFSLVEEEFITSILAEFVETTSQLDVIIDILIRDGRNILKLDWFSRLYENEIQIISTKVNGLTEDIENEKSDLSFDRRRDYLIYKSCLSVAYKNDVVNNREAKITSDELSILINLSKQLELSQEEVKLINYSILPIKKLDIDDLINSLKNIGILFFSKKSNTVYVPDEIVAILRKVRKKELADKYFKRILKSFREPQLNLICKRHNIDRRLSSNEKIAEIIKEGISIYNIFSVDLHKEGTTLNEKKKFLSEFVDKTFGISSLKGLTLDDKIKSLIEFFESIEKDDKVSISLDGYQKLIIDLGNVLPQLNDQLRKEFEFHANSSYIDHLIPV